jgi:signal transduction histidine kinase
LSRELRPRILEDLGLRAALEFLADGVAKRTESVVTTKVDVEERLPPLVETTVYRLIQEALTNASRHAKATHIDVTLARDGLAIRRTIRDNGVGFSVHETFGRKGDNSLGLPGIRDRLEAFGGTLQIDSGPIEGTILTILIPELIPAEP